MLTAGPSDESPLGECLTLFSPSTFVDPISVRICRDMLEIMREYGSEVSDATAVPRKDSVQKASVVRQFRRWNPSFFQHFVHRNGKWIPKLGKKAELERRDQARKDAARSRNGTGGSKNNKN